jgi:hypothetical protein
MMADVITEEHGVVYTLDCNEFRKYSSLPSLSLETFEYEAITIALQGKIEDTDNPRHRYIVSGEWDSSGHVSCWLSFQVIGRVLIAMQRSCSMEIMASDLGFLSRLALTHRVNKLVWVIGSLHERKNI